MHLLKIGSFLCTGMTFGWEFFLSFILVATVYACAIGAPNFGEQLALLHVIIMLCLDCVISCCAYTVSYHNHIS